ncbi:MAG TPA: hypothetical protein VGM98_14375 [Schlesneria sp.]
MRSSFRDRLVAKDKQSEHWERELTAFRLFKSIRGIPNLRLRKLGDLVRMSCNGMHLLEHWESKGIGQWGNEGTKDDSRIADAGGDSDSQMT